MPSPNSFINLLMNLNIIMMKKMNSMTKHLTLLLLIGFIIWSCEEEELSLIGRWKSYDFIYTTSTGSSFSSLDSIKEDYINGAYKYEFNDLNLIIFHNQSEISTYPYTSSNDTLFLTSFSPFIRVITYTLDTDLILTFPEEILTSETGDNLGTFSSIRVFQSDD